MATNTYVALASVTASGTSSVLVMNNIPQTYTDLVLVAQYLKSGTGSARLILNNDSSSLYSQTVLYGNGTSAGSGRDSGTYFYLMDYLQSSTSNPNMAVVHLMNYSNTTTYKTVLERSGVADKGTVANVGLYRSTNAITRIDIADASNFAAGTTFSLYGIRAEGVSPAPKATGGAIYSDSTYYYHVFGSTGTFTPLQSLTADVLVVAGGGGGGGANIGGGGGAGGLLYSASQSLSATGYTCTVGAGGAGSTTLSSKGTNGGNSQFGSITASVGGGGGASSLTTVGANGGSGGGGSNSTEAASLGGTGTAGQGYDGGGGGNTYDQGGGGGGAGAVGQTTASPAGSQRYGGAGINTYATWATATGTGDGNGYYAGGGAGGISTGTSGYTLLTTRSAGGGGIGITQALMNALPYTGSGGAGFSYSANGFTGNGGSGVIIVRYAKA